MIVDAPPYDLVALFADQDAKYLFDALIERGQERGCLRPIRWRSLRDPRRDAFVQHPTESLAPFLRSPDVRFFITWDEAGSGTHVDAPQAEADVRAELARAGVEADRILAVAFVPELEALFRPVWKRVVELLAELRERTAPAQSLILQLARELEPSVPQDFDQALALTPKEMLGGALRALQHRPSAAIYEKLGQQVSISEMKRSQAAARVAATLQQWFPPA